MKLYICLSATTNNDENNTVISSESPPQYILAEMGKITYYLLVSPGDFFFAKTLPWS